MSATPRSTIIFSLNGKRCEVSGVEPETSLLDYLRRVKRLTGAKLGCGEGGCGACTVLLTRFEHGESSVRHRAINACLMPLCAVDGCAVTTVEGIGNAADPHPVQERIAKLHGSQCGFCTPGIVMALYSKLQDTPEVTVADIEDCFDGNLCRCTGYRPILDAAKTFAKDGETAIPNCATCSNAEACGVVSQPGGEFVTTTTRSKVVAPRPEERMNASAKAPPTLDSDIAKAAQDEVLIQGRQVTWFRPATKDSLLQFMDTHGANARIVVGNSEIAIETKVKGTSPPLLVSTAAVAELQAIRVDEKEIVIGAAAPLVAVAEALEGQSPASVATAVSKMLRWFASSQIRHVACLGGNLCTASPIGDIAPTLLAVDATLEVASAKGGVRYIDMSKWIAGYRRVNLQPGEVLVSIRIPRGTEKDHFVKAFKQARRRDDDISIVTSSFAAKRAATGTIEVTSGHGGVAPVPRRFVDLDEVLTALLTTVAVPEPEATSRVVAAVAKAIDMGPATPGGMPAFRRALVVSMALRFVRLARQYFYGEVITVADDDETYMESGHVVTSGTQRYIKDVAGNNLTHARPVPFVKVEPNEPRHPGTVGEPEPHSSALLHCTGEAKYVDDVVLPADGLYSAFVWSDRPTGEFTIEGIADAEAMDGVHVVVTASDLTPEQNTQGVEIFDEELFRARTVTAVGQAIALVGAETYEKARAAARRIRVVYSQPTTPSAPVVTISDARSANSRVPGEHPALTKGDPVAAFNDANVVAVKGTVRVAGQEHFYLETTAATAVPSESDELEVLSSTQFCSGVHSAVCRTVGLPQNKVIIKAKRLGGGFGGKETRATWVACVAAVAARKCRRAVRVSLDRSEDMQTQGTRHPFLAEYNIGVTKQGKLVAFDVQLHSNTGYATDLGLAVMGRAVYNIAGPYKFPHLAVQGNVWHTNTGNNTGFRGFGAPQATLIVETAVEHAASAIGMDPHELRRLNLIQDGDTTHYGQQIKGQTLNRLWEAAVSPANADFDARRAAVKAFNVTHRHQKRGIAMTAVLYGVGLPGPLHHASALINLYVDGTVFVSHGGVDMGQGLNIKVMQVVAAALGVSLSRVFTKEMDTSKIPNAAPSAASVSFDLNGMAALDACEKINQRLAPFRASGAVVTKVDDEDFKRVVNAAFNAKVPLSATGFTAGRVPEADGSPGVDIGFDFHKPVSRGTSNSQKGTPMQYWTQAVGCSEVELDTATGDYRVLRTDIVMDIGSSTNPGVDIGQIEGAYVQGMGLYTMEETVWGSKSEHPWIKEGQCFTRGPGNYKIPSFNDVPVDFRVALLGGAPNPRGVHGSKAVGEPPLLLGASAFLAAKDAIAAAREQPSAEEKGASYAGRFFPVDSPLTAERARLACNDSIASFFVAENVAKGGLERANIFV